MLIETTKQKWLSVVDKHNDRFLDLSALSEAKYKEHFLVSQDNGKINGFAYLSLHFDNGYYYQLSTFNFFLTVKISNGADKEIVRKHILPVFYEDLLTAVKRNYISKQIDCDSKLMVQSSPELLAKAIKYGNWTLDEKSKIDSRLTIGTIDLGNRKTDSDDFFHLNNRTNLILDAGNQIDNFGVLH